MLALDVQYVPPTMTHSLPCYSRDQDKLGALYEEGQKMCLGMMGSRDGAVVQKLYKWPSGWQQ